MMVICEAPLTFNTLAAAGEYCKEYATREGRARLRNPDVAQVLKLQLCWRFNIDMALLDLAITDMVLGLAHPSEAFVNARDAAQRLKGRRLTMMELAEMVKTIEDQEAVLDFE
jgi:hypothetical protein